MSSRSMDYDYPVPGSHWWLVLFEGIAAIILGILLMVNTVGTVGVLVWFLGIYWLVTGVLSLVSLLWNRSEWGWKLFTGILGIIAGLFIIQNPLISALVLPASLAFWLGILGIVIGISQLIQAFRGGGWGLGVLGVLSILLGFLLLTRPVVAGFSLAFLLGILLILGGILAVFAAFSLRRMGREYEAARVQAYRSTGQVGSTVSGTASQAASTVTGVAGATAVSAAGLAPDGEDAASRAGEDAAGVVGDAAETAGDAAGAAAGGAAGWSAEGLDAAIMAGEGAAGAGDALFTGNVDPRDLEEMTKFKSPLEYIEGVGTVFAEKLKAIGIMNCLDLIRAGSTSKGRAEIVARSGISANLILEWVNHVDLYRIKGVGSEYADLLEASGVDTVVELAQRNAVNLFAKMNNINVEKRLVRRPPTQSQVENWIAQAKGLPRLITY